MSTPSARRCIARPLYNAPKRRSVLLPIPKVPEGLSVRFTTASQLVHELIETRNKKTLLRFQDRLAKVSVLIIDELGYVPCARPEANSCSMSSAGATRTATPSTDQLINSSVLVRHQLRSLGQ